MGHYSLHIALSNAQHIAIFDHSVRSAIPPVCSLPFLFVALCHIPRYHQTGTLALCAVNIDIEYRKRMSEIKLVVSSTQISTLYSGSSVSIVTSLRDGGPRNPTSIP